MLDNNRNRVTGTDPDRRDTRDNTGAMIIGALAVVLSPLAALAV